MGSLQPFPDIKASSPDMGASILENSIFKGTPFLGETLEHSHLSKADLLPRYELAFGNGTIWLSDLYYLLDNRIAVIGYVKVGNTQPVVRSFYRSKSQGVWRYLPDYTVKDNLFDWTAKGQEHGHITACLALQHAFEFIEGDNIPKYIEYHEFVFAGTARERLGKEIYIGSSGEPVKLEGNFYPEEGKRIPPEQLTFTNQSQTPNFSNHFASWSKKSDTYDMVRVDIFASQDEKLLFMFCRDPKNRAWIATVENTNGQLTSTGINRPWITSGDLVTPAYEYEALSYAYGDSNNRQGPYIDMFEKYLSKIPLIQEYLKVANNAQ